jgi:hypothetical protein
MGVMWTLGLNADAVRAATYKVLALESRETNEESSIPMLYSASRPSFGTRIDGSGWRGR